MLAQVTCHSYLWDAVFCQMYVCNVSRNIYVIILNHCKYDMTPRLGLYANDSVDCLGQASCIDGRQRQVVVSEGHQRGDTHTSLHGLHPLHDITTSRDGTQRYLVDQRRGGVGEQAVPGKIDHSIP